MTVCLPATALQPSLGQRRPRIGACRHFIALGLALGLLAFGAAQAATITVRSNADAGAGSLRQALIDATPGDTIDFSPTAVPTITLASELVIDKALTISGPGADLQSIINEGGRVFTINAGGAAVTISGLGLTGRGHPQGVNGGAILNAHGALTLDAVEISNSSVTAAWNGGGLGGGVYSPVGSSLTIRNSTLASNQAGKGGAIYALAQGVWIENSTFTGNTVTDSGGAMSIEMGAWATIQQSTIYNNSANIGAGVYVRDRASAEIKNTVAAQNWDRNNGAPLLNDVDHGNNTVGATGSLFSESDPASVVHNGANSANLFGMVDPKLGTLAANGGHTMTMVPQADSPAIDGAACIGLPTSDQRGVARPMGAQCDIGAVEVGQYALAVTVTGSGSVTANAPPLPISGDVDHCTSAGGLNCTGIYREGDSVTLVATAAAGQQFAGWTGACTGAGPSCTLLMTQARETTARFVPIPPPTAVPTLGEWSLLMLGLLAAGTGVRRLRRRD